MDSPPPPDRNNVLAIPPRALRQRAEVVIHNSDAQSLDNAEAVSPEETRAILHDLRVHQIELELQNEELRRLQLSLDAERARYFDLYNLAPVGYCAVNKKGLILQANLAAATLLGEGRRELVGRPITRHILKEDQDVFYLNRKLIFESGEPRAFELRMVKHDSTLFWAHLTVAVAQEADGTSVLRVALGDINERKQLEQALTQSEAHYRRLFDNAVDGIITLSATGKLVAVNNSFARMHGYGTKELQNLYLKDLDTDNTSELASARMRRIFSGESLTFEVEHKHADGHTLSLEVSANPFHSPEGPQIECFYRDISERARLRKELLAQRDRLEELVTARTAELRSMATELLTLEIRERRDLAESLHDDLGQNLAIAKLKLGALGHSSEGEDRERFLRQLKEIEALVDRSNQSVRTLSAQFSPPVLREFGLATALDWLCDELRRTLGLSIKLQLCDLGAMSEATATALYRMVRELLINIAKHAQVGEAELIMAMDEAGENLEITVSDAGIGFDMEQMGKRLTHASYGLSSIRQRLAIMMGMMSIDSQAGQGTIVTLSIPLAAEIEPL